MKHISFFLFIIILSAFTLAQNIKVRDTIRVAAFQNIDVPPLVLTNILRIDYNIDLLDANLQKIRDCKNFTQKPKKEEWAKATAGQRGTTFILSIKESIEKTGTFYIRIAIKASGEKGGLNDAFYYAVIVENPTLAAPVTIRSDYFYSEKESFSFATVEFNDITAYSYKIEDSRGGVFLEGKGPIVKLDSVLKTISNVGQEMTVKGFYNGKQFSFIDPVTKAIKNSEWKFSIKEIDVDVFAGVWKKYDPKTTDEEGGDFASMSNNNARTIMFTLLGKKSDGSGYIFAKPEIRGSVQVSSEPAEFLAGTSTISYGTVWLNVKLNVSEDYLKALPPEGEEVKVTISFTTVFGTKVTKEYHATVIL
ncbi:MAG: hypothetical protein WCS69_13145 [Ignavibacteriaceae bacterium]|jgi:hypothetical protein